ncbi:hypothetical protein QFC24_003692 [Naganishia onofrii]|uniref:Uncharacterized protein n=1 Tax=Naganishia onofrii TaxID=1851511 RepID=A0ACC2XI16_9TREE|nr:hypothetical protein QFC24_003692 [Naganishia onofrii]
MNSDAKGNLCIYPSTMASGRPGWVHHFEQQLEDHPSAKSYPFASVDTNGSPRVRYVVHRALTPESSFLIFTTDTRMGKCTHLASDGRCEASFWMEGSGVQFRVAGEALIVPNDADVSPSAQKALESAVQKDSVRAVGEEKKADYWIGERERNWTKGISGHLRATFARPTPGTPLDKVDRKPEDWTETMKPEGETVSIRCVPYSHAPHACDAKFLSVLGWQDEQKQEAASAKANFTLVAIAPHTVEMLELKAVPNRRTVWTRPEQAGGQWTVQAVVP